MVSFADVLQAIKGTDFPATREDLLTKAKEKEGGALFTKQDMQPILEFLQALPENSVYRNPAKLAEVLGATQQALERDGHIPADAKPAAANRSQDAPLGLGELQPADDIAERARQLHEGRGKK